MAMVNGTTLMVIGHKASDVVEVLDKMAHHSLVTYAHLLNSGRSANIKCIRLTPHGNLAQYSSRTQRVDISWDACNGQQLRGQASTTQLIAETALFELQNGLNATANQTLENNARAGLISLMAYGVGMAVNESLSTETVSRCLRDIGRPWHVGGWPGFDCSAWGRGHIASIALHGGNIGQHVANTPHGAVAGENSLLSKHFYMYKLGITRNEIDNVCDRITTAQPTRPAGGAVANGVGTFGGFGMGHRVRNGAFNGPWSIRELVMHYIKTLSDLGGAGWTVAWRDGTEPDWVAYVNDVLANLTVADVARVNVLSLQNFLDLLDL